MDGGASPAKVNKVLKHVGIKTTTTQTFNWDGWRYDRREHKQQSCKMTTSLKVRINILCQIYPIKRLGLQIINNINCYSYVLLNVFLSRVVDSVF